MLTRNGGISYPGGAWRPALSYTPESFSERFKTSPNAVRVEWWKALPDPSFNSFSGKADFEGGKGQWQREKQPGTYFVLLDSERVLRRYFQAGTWESGSIALTFDPSETALSIDDWVVEVGQSDLPAGAINARTLTQKHNLVRAEHSVDGAGTITVMPDLSVVGVGTAFQSFFRAGDILTTKSGGAVRVSSIASDTVLSLASAPSVPVRGASYGKGADRFLYPKAAQVLDVRDANGAVYVPGVDVDVSEDGEIVEWLGQNAPAPGVRYGISYQYYPRYVVTDLGTQGQVVNGKPLPSLVAARLWKPENTNT